ncbi:serine/threonine-protein kinase [Streptomyces sp. SID3343]|uniref:serine/threonine-protein kinase n=1 Tax=Streptomyces sp. SID3343 TaxID=2690260 RepID=UPI00136F9873|nr:serine/threonine-protein kinase [Streptomyces sp. SID3343]MYW05305.1 protein kinase [Streptomyces sp. SID3343]
MLKAKDLLQHRYRLDQPLARGSMGMVWQGTDQHLGRPIAIKVVHTSESGDDGSRLLARFRREAATAALLNHPNIAGVHDAGATADGICWLVMQLIEGATVDCLLSERGPFTVAAAAAVASQVCAGLAEAHKQQLVHRDLKLANLMVDRAGLVKILDFGLVKLLAEQATRLTVTGENVGNVLYASPELIRGDDALDGRSDLYAVGCLLHHLLTGSAPFAPEPLPLLAGQHLLREPPTLADCGIEVPPRLQDLVLALLAKEPGGRPDSAAAVHAALAEYVPSPRVGGAASGIAASEDPCRPFLFPFAPLPG